ncbi:MAG: sigma-70 family RNA polymerase sigma factor [Planctomycetales bacterium]|nr:sigma-70 family RNA polymerase sigma factor [Planctomycetales bacterium]
MTSLASDAVVRLIQSAKAGDDQALDELFRGYHSYVNLVARIQFDVRRTPQISPSDIAQETLLKAQRSIRQFQGSSESEWTAWLRSILAAQICSTLRYLYANRRDVRLERQIRTQLDASSEILGELADHRSGSPSASSIRREQAVLLADAIADLAEDYREVLIMRHMQGISFAEIARDTQRTVDSVKSVWRRAILQLRMHLADLQD